ncbi:hypothetical protein DRE_00051 [Drechslerella stenobrocha 248]|uniref:BZIP domain-containing protein n=1 Tax=Drechslerella stenobrocha 248 TaxID=1043628 RepID=W7HX35_9PEZI|nr:hypothetical protein DRE_00051 [Drechslerella stenobrocha 248]
MAVVSSSSSVDLGKLGVGSALPEQQFQCAAGPEEDWTGTVDPKVRRKLQNRLNQRAYRRRKLHDKAMKVNNTRTVLETTSDGVGSTSSQSFEHSLLPIQVAAMQAESANFAGSQALVRGASCTMVPDPRTNGYRLQPSAPKIAPDHLLLSLIHYNVIRAFLSNLSYFQISLSDLMSDDLLSTFCTSSTVPDNLPPTLYPTAMQMLYPHHPYVDLFPCAVARDNMIMMMSRDKDLVEEAMCDDLCCTEGNSGLVVWGPPERIESWEVTPSFASKWSWLVKGCYDLQRATNRWREARGDLPIRFEEVND